MNVPNLLSIFRLFVTFFFIMAVHADKLRLALYLFIIQGVSDILDGFIARVMGKKTTLGAFLDPLADKTMLVAAFVMLSVKGIIPVWLTIMALVRDVIIATGFFILYRMKLAIKPVPTIFGKITTACQIATIVYVLWSCRRVHDNLFFYATAFFTLISGLHYIYVGIRMLREPKAEQSTTG